MGVEPLRLGEADRGRGEAREARFVAADNRRPLHKVEDAEPRGKTRAACGRQHVVGAGDVVADRFRRMASEKDRAGVADSRGERLRFVDRQFEVLGGDAVDERGRLVPIGDANQRAVCSPAGARGVGARQVLQIAVDLMRDGGDKTAIVADQDRLRRIVVLGLREEVGGDPGGIVVGAGDDKDLRRPSDHVDADAAKDPPLRGRDIGVARPDDLVDRGDRRGAVGERCHRLGTTDAVDLGDAGEASRGEDKRIEHAVRRRHGHDHALDLGDLGRDRVHQHRGGIGRSAARHVEPDRGERPPALAEPHAFGVDIVDLRRQLLPVKALDPLGGEFKRGNGLGRRGVGPGGDLRRREAQVVGRQPHPVETLCVVDQRRVAARRDIVDDRRDGGVDIGRTLALCRQERDK